MKKSILSVIAIALVGVIFTSCTKEKTVTEKLTVEKGWVLEAATCPEGYGANAVTDLMAMFTEANGGLENDDVILFKADGNKQYINAGANRYDFEGEGDQYVGTWSLNENETVLSCQLPMFKAGADEPETAIYSATPEECNIISLTEDKMVLSHTFTVSNSGAKWQEGTWTFQLTYVRAK